jgi:hypothetical protein
MSSIQMEEMIVKLRKENKKLTAEGTSARAGLPGGVAWLGSETEVGTP